MILKYINEDNKFTNIKQVAKEHFQMSDRLLCKLKNKKLIFKNTYTAKVTEKISLHDVIEFYLDYEESSDNIIPTKMDLDIIYEDDFLLIINKPPFLPVHPSLNYYENSLSNGVKYYFNQINLNKKIRIVNRLDKDTSGLVIFAKNEYIQESLIKQMQSSKFTKKYLGILIGIFDTKEGFIEAPIARKKNSIIEREINPNGQFAKTYFKVLKEENNMSLVEFTLETGRTHQIRLHAKYKGHPLLGDTLYGTKTNLINRQALHAFHIQFIHPISKKILTFTIKLPEDMEKIISYSNY